MNQTKKFADLSILRINSSGCDRPSAVTHLKRITKKFPITEQKSAVRTLFSQLLRSPDYVRAYD
jgi:hypothetical protein